jgi:hypothetical protein
MLQRSANEKKQSPFFWFLFVYPKFEIIFAPSYAAPLVQLRRAGPPLLESLEYFEILVP